MIHINFGWRHTTSNRLHIWWTSYAM